jgi:hypothetical protein
MKTLGKLNINPEKVMKNEELITLRGGDYGDLGTCNYSGVSGVAAEMCGYPRSWVELWANTYGGHWCCDSCGQTNYC